MPALVAILLAACGAGGPGAGGTGTGEAEQPPAASQPDPQLYEGNGMVCEDGTGGPLLWLGGARALLAGPPECGGVPLVNWDWQAVEGEETAGTKVWGSYHVVGSYDGETFAVTEAGPYEDDSSAFGTDPDFTSPCDEPAGGWVVPDPAHNTQNEAHRVSEYARSQPGYVASWVNHLEPDRLEFSPVLVNVVFTGDAERHEAEIRKVWDGPLCVVARRRNLLEELVEAPGCSGAQEIGVGDDPPSLPVVLAEPGDDHRVDVILCHQLRNRPQRGFRAAAHDGRAHRVGDTGILE